MLKSCKYCGRIHESKLNCGKKPVHSKRGNDKDKFRWTAAWQKKREEIKQRDLYLCQVCIRDLYNARDKYNYNNLEVHHVVSLEDDFDKRLDNDNLITVCAYHHELAECGEISLNEVQQIIAEQTRR